ncbi:MAG: hypothetical protein QXF12_07070 [Candidatus Aenigmatarchaeota archaeon]
MIASGLVDFIKNIASKTKKIFLRKDEIQEKIDYFYEEIGVFKDVCPESEEINNYRLFSYSETKKFKDNFYKKLKENLDKDFKVRLSYTDLFKDLRTLIKNVEDNLVFVGKKWDEYKSNTVSIENIDAYKANLLRAVGHIGFISKYSLDLLNWVFSKEYTHNCEVRKLEVSDEYNISPGMEKEFLRASDMYALMMSVYSVPLDVFSKKLEDIDNIELSSEVDPEGYVRLFKKIDFDSKLSMFTQGFVPIIYNLRLLFLLDDIEQYYKLKDEKALLLLRYQHLKELLESGKVDPKLEKEIAYLQEDIDDINYRLKKIEKHYGVS